MKVVLKMVEKRFFKFLFALISTLIELSWLIAASYVIEFLHEWWALTNIFIVLVSTIGVLFMSVCISSVCFFFCNSEIGCFTPYSFWCRTVIRLLLFVYFIYDFTFQIYYVPIIVQVLFFVMPYIVGSFILLAKRKTNCVSKHVIQRNEAFLGGLALSFLFIACFLLVGPLINILPMDLWQLGCYASTILAILSIFLLLGMKRIIPQRI